MKKEFKSVFVVGSDLQYIKWKEAGSQIYKSETDLEVLNVDDKFLEVAYFNTIARGRVKSIIPLKSIVLATPA